MMSSRLRLPVLVLIVLAFATAPGLYAQDAPIATPPDPSTPPPTLTETPLPTATLTETTTATLEPTLTLTPTPLPSETATATASPPPEVTDTETSTVTASPSPSASPTATASPTLVQPTATLTATPRMLPTQPQNAGISPLAMQTDPTVPYVVVDNNTSFWAALNNGSSAAYPSVYRIFLKPGDYLIGFTTLINGGKNIKIYGMGSAVTRIFSTINVDTPVFYVQPGGSLELYDLTFGTNSGVTPAIYYGQIVNNYGSLKVSGSRFENTLAINGGGSIFNAGTLTITNTIFSNNRAGTTNQTGGGGAIQLGGGTFNNSSCIDFQVNRAGYGGAILNSGGGQVSLPSSRFNGNFSTNAGGGAVFNLDKPNPSVNVSGSWWPTHVPNPPPVNDTVPGTDTVSTGINVSPLAPSDPMTSGVCKLPPTFSQSPPLAADELLTYYGVNVTSPGGWTTTEINTILAGVRDTAISLAIQSNRAPIDAFNTVMRRPALDTAPINLVFSKSGGGSTCLTTANTPTTIVCGTGITLSKYTVVHELGHVFDNRSDQPVNSIPSTSLEEYVATTNPNPGQSILDNNGRLVMGTFRNPNTGNTIWDRGPRGWGTGPASNYDAQGVALSRVLTNMQQNSPPYTISGESPEANKETAADMFLNWTYRTLDPLFSDPFQPPTGFKNISWDPWGSPDLGQGANVCNISGCADPRNPGDARFNWMNSNMTSIFVTHAWNS